MCADVIRVLSALTAMMMLNLLYSASCYCGRCSSADLQGFSLEEVFLAVQKVHWGSELAELKKSSVLVKGLSYHQTNTSDLQSLLGDLKDAIEELKTGTRELLIKSKYLWKEISELKNAKTEMVNTNRKGLASGDCVAAAGSSSTNNNTSNNSNMIQMPHQVKVAIADNTDDGQEVFKEFTHKTRFKNYARGSGKNLFNLLKAVHQKWYAYFEN